MFDGGVSVCRMVGMHGLPVSLPLQGVRGEVEGGDGSITQQLHNKNKILHVILSLLANFTFLTTAGTFSIRCSTKSFDRVVSYMLGKVLRALFLPH